MAPDEHRLMQVRETTYYRAAVSAAAHHQDPYWAAKQLAGNVVRHGSPSLHELPQRFPRVCQVLYREFSLAAGERAPQRQKSTRETR
jgi:hypothetical protein